MDKPRQRACFLYEGSLSDGTVFDDCNGEPHEIILGRHQVMPIVDEALQQMEPGEERTLEIPAAEAYGEYDESAVQKVPAYKIPNGENIPVGEMVAWTHLRSAEPVPAKVLSIENQIITLDFNHPLAGKDIVYWIKLIEVKS